MHGRGWNTATGRSGWNVIFKTRTSPRMKSTEVSCVGTPSTTTSSPTFSCSAGTCREMAMNSASQNVNTAREGTFTCIVKTWSVALLFYRLYKLLNDCRRVAG